MFPNLNGWEIDHIGVSNSDFHAEWWIFEVFPAFLTCVSRGSIGGGN